MTELEQKRIRGAVVNDRTKGAGPLVPDSIFTITVDGKTEEMMFTFEEISDSANGKIEDYAILKVRDLVGRFIPG